MKLVKCRKCGTAVMTDDSLLENMISEMNEYTNKTRYAKGSDVIFYSQKVSQLKKMITQIQHRTTEMENRTISNRTTLSKLKEFVIENKLMSLEQIESIEREAVKEMEANNKKDSEVIEKVYGSYRNSMVNRTNKDTTARQAFKNI